MRCFGTGRWPGCGNPRGPGMGGVETDTSTHWSQVRVGGEPLSYKNGTEHIER